MTATLAVTVIVEGRAFPRLRDSRYIPTRKPRALTETLTATAGADTSGQRRTPVPVTWFDRTPVRACPPPPRTTDHEAGP